MLLRRRFNLSLYRLLNVHCVLCILKVEMLRMKMEGMSKGMRERMAEYTRRLEAVASGDNAAGCQSRKCGGRHSRKASAGSQRSWSGGSTASNGTAPSALDAAPHGRTRHAAAAENRHQQQQHKVQFKLKPPITVQFVHSLLQLGSLDIPRFLGKHD